jgi:osmotically-inducible protein OsmY
MQVRRSILVGVAATFIATGWIGAGQTASTGQTASNGQSRPDADNTGRNVRDRDGQTRTPTDQGESGLDRDITASIRREIVANDALSTNAHNVKIITVDGIVTLRGPVKTVQEKATVAAAAKHAAGVRRVDDQLEIERRD